MKIWLTSRNGALVLSFTALLSLLARSYYDVRFILTEEYSPLMPEMDTLWIIGLTVFIGLNVAFLLVATANGNRGAWIGLFAFNLLTGLGSGAGSLLVFTSNTLELVLFLTCLFTGSLAAVSVGTRLLKRKTEAPGTAV